MGNRVIPTIDLSPFFSLENDVDGKKKVVDMIQKRCSDYAFFYIVNHGVPQELLNKAMQLSKTFFNCSDEEKLKSIPVPGAPFPVGYHRQPETATDSNEYILMCPPGCGFNILPSNPPDLKETMEEFFSQLSRTGELIIGLINDCLGIPHNFLKEYNDDRSWDMVVAMNYPPATETKSVGITQHNDGNYVSLVVQDDVGGLEALIDGEWTAVIPAEGKILVSVGDVIQVLTNNRFKSTTHRVVSPKRRTRNAFVYSYNIHGDKWIEPMPHYTKEIQEPPKFRGFVYKEYLALRMRNKTHPPPKPEDVISIAHYAISINFTFMWSIS